MRPLSDVEFAAATATLVASTWLGVDRLWWAICIAAVAWLAALSRRVPSRSRWMILLAGLLVVIGAHRSTAAWHATAAARLGPYSGWATAVGDPVDVGRGTRVVVEVQGQRFDLWAFGRVRAAVGRVAAGEQIWIVGTRTPSPGGRRAAVRHVVGRLVVETVADRREGSPAMSAANRVRSRIIGAAEDSMPPVESALFSGLVLGDDRRQPTWLVDAFRRAGLSHLTAVSGQNVAYVLAGCAPLLSRLRPRARWAATCALVLWFMAVTRFEPSVLRAGVMAIVAATAFLTGRTASPMRLVLVACALLVAIDPLLVWSVSLWMSVGATLGVIVAGPWCVARLPGPRWFRQSLGTSLGAQVGVAVPSLLVFGRLPFVGPFANLLAVPVAGLVMLCGVPAGLLAPALPDPLGGWMMGPLRWGTVWVEAVALRAAQVGPEGIASLVCWALSAGGWTWWWRARGRRVPI